LVRASREAGAAEITNGVLHNVKNVITSLNVSASILAGQVQKSIATSLTKVSGLLGEHANDLGSFLTEHPKGKLLPVFIETLAEQVAAERAAMLEELQHFDKDLQLIKTIVTTQQDYAKLCGTSEKAKPVELMEDSLRINAAALARHGVQVVREYAPDLPEITVEKHKVLQILVNLIRNAKDACQASDRPDRKVVVRAALDGEFVHLVVSDNGIGIPPENLKRVFQYGFTTKKSGHGFGLHSGAIAVQDLGGDLHVQSGGAGAGATFTLRLPHRQAAAKPPGELAAATVD
jgi:signal transduction histidine kinase